MSPSLFNLLTLFNLINFISHALIIIAKLAINFWPSNIPPFLTFSRALWNFFYRHNWRNGNLFHQPHMRCNKYSIFDVFHVFLRCYARREHFRIRSNFPQNAQKSAVYLFHFRARDILLYISRVALLWSFCPDFVGNLLISVPPPNSIDYFSPLHKQPPVFPKKKGGPKRRKKKTW